MSRERLYLFDTTLRDGAQTNGVDFTLHDKRIIAGMLDELGIDYVEGGYPGANPTDTEFFAERPPLNHARFTAFGMTRRAGRSAENDPSLALKVWMASRLFRLSAMTSALPTGRVELVTLPRTCRKAGSGTSDCAGTARMTMAVVAIAIARSRRIGSLLRFPASESKESFATSQMAEREVSVRKFLQTQPLTRWPRSRFVFARW